MTDSSIVHGEVRYRARDGVLLAADTFHADDGQPHPTLLLRTPYGRTGARGGVDVFGLVRAGWAVVSADTRGRGDSEGSGAPYLTEASDGADTLSWCAEQPWCDGRVAMAGPSYLGFTQWQAAATGHRALRAIAPSQAPLGARDGWQYEGGAFLASGSAQWGWAMAGTDRTTTPEQHERLEALTRDPAVWMATAPAVHPLRELYPPYENWIRPDDDAYWGGFDVSPLTRPMDVAGFHVAGWYDAFCETSIRGWHQLREHATGEYARASQRLVIGYWPHGGVGAQSMPGMDFLPGSDLGGSGAAAMLYPWLRDALDGKPVEDGVRAFVMGHNRWWDLPDWPPPAEPLELHLGGGGRGADGDGRLSTTLADADTDAFEHDPNDPVPSHGGRLLGLWRPMPGPYDQRPIEQRGDVLVYTSPVLAGPLTIAGPVRAHVAFSTSAVSADVTAKLVDVHPDGRAINLLDSICRRDFVPGTAVEVTVELGTVAHAFLAGHRIRLEVASSNAPRFNPNPSTGAALNEPGPMLRADQRVHHGGRSGSRLVLPLVADLDGEPTAPALAALAG